MSETNEGISAAPANERLFQVRSIRTQDLTFKQIASNEEVDAIIRNSHAIFRLHGNKATRRPDGQWDLEVTFTPDNGMMAVQEWKPIVYSSGKACTCHERDGSYACDYCKSQGIRGHMERGV